VENEFFAEAREIDAEMTREDAENAELWFFFFFQREMASFPKQKSPNIATVYWLIPLIHFCHNHSKNHQTGAHSRRTSNTLTRVNPENVLTLYVEHWREFRTLFL
jgi:hypothetical protein